MLKRSASSITASIVISSITIFFVVIASGLNLGSRSKKRESNSVSATLAAKEFVCQALRKQDKRTKEQETPVIFSEQDCKAERDFDSNNRWIVTGKARLVNANLQWSITEEWDGEHEWTLKAIQVIGPKR